MATGKPPGGWGFLLLATLPFPFIEAAAADSLLDRFIFGGVYFYALCWLSAALVLEALKAEKEI